MLNPYASPVEVERKALPKPDAFIRLMAGILAVSGVIYLPTVVFVIFIPGGVVWWGWVRIACGNDSYNNEVFWAFSLLWNGGWLTFFTFSYFRGEIGGAPLLLIHSLVAAAFSVAALRHQVGPVVFD